MTLPVDVENFNLDANGFEDGDGRDEMRERGLEGWSMDEEMVRCFRPHWHISTLIMSEELEVFSVILRKSNQLFLFFRCRA